jgi:hypothetical protein
MPRKPHGSIAGARLRCFISMSPRGRLVSVAMSVVAIGAVSSASAQGVRLDWARAASASECPDRAELERRVRETLGRDPFAAPHEFAIEGTVSREAGELVATLVLRAGGEIIGERTLHGAGDCDRFAPAVELALLLAIDELLPEAPPEEPAARASAPAVPPVVEPPPIVESPAPRARSGPRIEGSAAIAFPVSIGVLPRPAVGIGLGFALAIDAWVLEISAHYFPEVSEVENGTEYGFDWIALAAAGGHRFRFGRWSIDAVVGFELGAIDAVAYQRASPEPGASATLAPLVAARLRWAPNELFAVELGARGTVALVTNEYYAMGTERSIHTQAPAAFLAEIAVIGRFGEGP